MDYYDIDDAIVSAADFYKKETQKRMARLSEFEMYGHQYEKKLQVLSTAVLNSDPGVYLLYHQDSEQSYYHGCTRNMSSRINGYRNSWRKNLQDSSSKPDRQVTGMIQIDSNMNNWNLVTVTGKFPDGYEKVLETILGLDKKTVKNKEYMYGV